MVGLRILVLVALAGNFWASAAIDNDVIYFKLTDGSSHFVKKHVKAMVIQENGKDVNTCDVGKEGSKCTKIKDDGTEYTVSREKKYPKINNGLNAYSMADLAQKPKTGVSMTIKVKLAGTFGWNTVNKRWNDTPIGVTVGEEKIIELKDGTLTKESDTRVKYHGFTWDTKFVRK